MSDQRLGRVAIIPVLAGLSNTAGYNIRKGQWFGEKALALEHGKLATGVEKRRVVTLDKSLC